MAEQDVSKLINEFMEASKEQYGSYAHAAGYLGSALALLVRATGDRTTIQGLRQSIDLMKHKG